MISAQDNTNIGNRYQQALENARSATIDAICRKREYFIQILSDPPTFKMTNSL